MKLTRHWLIKLPNWNNLLLQISLDFDVLKYHIKRWTAFFMNYIALKMNACAFSNKNIEFCNRNTSRDDFHTSKYIISILATWFLRQGIGGGKYLFLRILLAMTNQLWFKNNSAIHTHIFAQRFSKWENSAGNNGTWRFEWWWSREPGHSQDCNARGTDRWRRGS